MAILNTPRAFRVATTREVALGAEIPTIAETPINVPQGFRALGSPEAQAAPAGNIFTRIAEPAATIATSIVAEPVAGLVGLARAPFVGAAQATRDIEATREELTFVPRTQAGAEGLQAVGEVLEPVGRAVQAAEKFTGDVAFEATGAPLAGAIGTAVPAAALEALGLGGVRRATTALRGRRAATQARTERAAAEAKAEIGISEQAEKLRAETVVRTVDDIKEELSIAKEGLEGLADSVSEGKPKTVLGQEIGSIKNDVPPENRGYSQIINDLKQGKIKRAALEVLPDEQIKSAADDLGIDLNPDHYSNNRQFIEVVQTLKSRADSNLSSREAKAIEKLGEKSDELIEELGGTTDKSLLDASIRDDYLKTIDDLSRQADKAYAFVDSKIPKSVRVKTLATKDYLKTRLKELGGDKTLLTSSEKRLLRLTKEGSPPTYAGLDTVRKNVGSALGKKQGIFKDDDAGTLKQIYRVLSEDQQGVAAVYGVAEEYAAARKLVQSRKDIESSVVNVFGDQVGGSIVPKLKQAGVALTKGDTSKFNALMKALPANRRQEVAASLLNDIFTAGARSKQTLGSGFVNAYEGLNRNAAAKNILFNELKKTPGARERFDKIGRVATGIFRAKALENTSKTARDLIGSIDDGGMLSKIYSLGKRAAIAEGITTSIGAPGIGTAGTIGGLLLKKTTSAVKRADELITSPAFSKAIKEAASGKARNAEKTIKRSQAFKNWVKTLPTAEAAELATVGFIPFITGQTETTQTQEGAQ